MLSRRACTAMSGILAATSLLLAALLAYVAGTPAAALPPAGQAAPAAAQDPAPAQYRLPGIGTEQDYAAIAARPLFSPTRRPPQTPPPAKTDAKIENPDGILLVGVVLSPTAKLAVIRTPQETTSREVSEGDKILDWRVETILADRIVLRTGDRSVEIGLLDQETIRKRYPKLLRKNAARKSPKTTRPKPANRLKPKTGE